MVDNERQLKESKELERRIERRITATNIILKASLTISLLTSVYVFYAIISLQRVDLIAAIIALGVSTSLALVARRMTDGTKALVDELIALEYNKES